MEIEPKTYFEENEYSDVKGFTVLEAEDGEYHIVEKWLASQDEESTQSEDTWIDYWVPESDLLDRMEDGHCTKKGSLTEDQFGAVSAKVGWEVVAQ